MNSRYSTLTINSKRTAVIKLQYTTGGVAHYEIIEEMKTGAAQRAQDLNNIHSRANLEDLL